FFLLSAVAIVVGVGLGRSLWQWAEESAKRRARTAPTHTPTSEKGPPSRLARWSTLLLAMAGVGGILMALPASSDYREGDPMWSLVAGGAMATGLLMARWLLMQGQVAASRAQPIRRIEWPPWTKWAVLAGIVALGVGALLWQTVVQASAGS